MAHSNSFCAACSQCVSKWEKAGGFFFFPLVTNMSHRCKIILTLVRCSKDILLATQYVLSHFKLKRATWICCACVCVVFACPVRIRANSCLLYTSPLLCFPWPRPLTESCFVIHPPVSLFCTHTVSSDSISALCVCVSAWCHAQAGPLHAGALQSGTMFPLSQEKTPLCRTHFAVGMGTETQY